MLQSDRERGPVMQCSGSTMIFNYIELRFFAVMKTIAMKMLMSKFRPIMNELLPL